MKDKDNMPPASTNLVLGRAVPRRESRRSGGSRSRVRSAKPKLRLSRGRPTLPAGRMRVGSGAGPTPCRAGRVGVGDAQDYGFSTMTKIGRTAALGRPPSRGNSISNPTRRGLSKLPPIHHKADVERSQLQNRSAAILRRMPICASCAAWSCISAISGETTTAVFPEITAGSW